MLRTYRIIECLEYLTQINPRGGGGVGIYCYVLAKFPNTMESSEFLSFRDDELKLAPDKFSMM